MNSISFAHAPAHCGPHIPRTNDVAVGEAAASDVFVAAATAAAAAVVAIIYRINKALPTKKESSFQ